MHCITTDTSVITKAH